MSNLNGTKFGHVMLPSRHASKIWLVTVRTADNSDGRGVSGEPVIWVRADSSEIALEMAIGECVRKGETRFVQDLHAHPIPADGEQQLLLSIFLH